MVKRGIFCISIDTELLWGRIDNPKPFFNDAKKVRLTVKKLLSLFEQYEIPATWAVVGKLFLKGESLWHGQDIIKMIQATKDQEIGCHSFSHLIFDEKKCPLKTAEKEIKNCLRMAKKAGIKFNSFVFPHNKIGYLELLKKNGFRCFRGFEPHWFNRIPKFKKIFQIIDFLFLLPPPVAKAKEDPSGLINVPASMYYVSARGLRKFIPIKIRVIKAKRGLNKAVEKEKMFHLWFHAIDLTQKSEKMFSGIEEILKYAVKLRNEGKLEIKSMGQIASSNL